LLSDIYAEDAVVYSPINVLEGRFAIGSFFVELQNAFPGLRAALHDEFYSADGSRACLRQKFFWHNAGTFRGHPPTGASGTMTETHALKIAEGRVVEQIIGASTFQVPRLLLAEWKLDFPRDVADPQPAILTASPDSPRHAVFGPGRREPSLARRFVDAFGHRDLEGLDELYAEDVQLYTPLGWPVRGRKPLKEFADQFHAANPGMRVALHDEFYTADGARACWRIKLHYHNTQPFYGNRATGDAGVMTETHSVRVRDGKIVQQVVGDNSFHMPYQELVLWKMEFPTDNPDPEPELMAAGPTGT
jgi:ketosteroid isomerase-like protein